MRQGGAWAAGSATMSRRMRKRIGAWTAAAAVAAVLVAPLPRPGPVARADEAEESLAEYRERVDASIDRALEFLAKHQEKDGAFESPMRKNTGVTGLALMAFLAKGHTPGVGPYGEVLNKGIDHILGAQQPTGMILGKVSSYGPMYSHCISTLLLSEVSGMVSPERQEKLDEVLGKGVQVILAAQQIQKPNAKHQGGWRYHHTSKDSDISCTGWAVMTLRSARNNGAAVPKKAIDDALQFVMNCRAKDGGFGYQPGGGPGFARTGTALLCLELCGRHRDGPAVGAGDWLTKHKPGKFGGSHFYYGIYYASQGMFQLGGTYWQKWGKVLYEMMLKHQNKDGSWPAGAGSAARAGSCYSTAMAVLAMSVSYRQLPIYQR